MAGDDDAPAHDYWVIGNRYGGAHWAHGATASNALALVRERIAESFAAEGLGPRDCRRAATSYSLATVGGPIPMEAAVLAAEAWDAGDETRTQRLIEQAGGTITRHRRSSHDL